MLNEFTVLAMYCLYFSKTPTEYAHLFYRLASYHNTKGITIAEVSDAAQQAHKYIEPIWKKELRLKEEAHQKEEYIRVNAKTISKLRRSIVAATKASKNGGQVTKELYKESLEKLRKQLSVVEGWDDKGNV